MIGAMSSDRSLDPAHSVITKCGGFAAVAEMTGRSAIRVRRWAYPREKGGTGGLIPAECQVLLLHAAPARGVDLRPEDFFASPPAPQPVE